MTAKEALKNELRDRLGPFLRDRGYRGSGSNWRKWSARGDCAIVNVQSSHWNTSDNQRCIINLSIIVPGDLDWHDFCSPSWKVNRKTPTAVWGMWQGRLHHGGAGPEEWWRVTNAQDARTEIADMIEQLSALGLPALEELLDRRNLIRAVAGEPVRGFHAARVPHWWALPLLLSDDGVSEALTAALDELDEIRRSRETSQEFAQTAQEFARWAKDRAKRVSAGAGA
ncbi:DUF4304 domain-containing protein [Leifsonia aquatica]|uniref:DUF4304 domain-containing protein n=1 Tax=Leifsonia aquatica TaxID=144185 RepID=UPI00384C0BE3